MDIHYLVILLTTICGLYSTIALILDGECPKEHETVKDILYSNMVGHWYTIYETKPAPDMEPGWCSQHMISLFGSTLHVTELNYLQSNKSYETIGARAEIPEDPVKSKLKVEVSTGLQKLNVNFEFLATDYTNYAITYACFNLSKGKRYEGYYILGRGPEDLSNDTKKTINDVLTKNNLPLLDTLHRVVQNCGQATCNKNNTSCQ